MSTLNFTPRVSVFDANVGVGHRHDRRYPFESSDQLLEEMAHHGVDRALVYEVQGELISPTQGNDALHKWTDSNHALVPQYVAGCDTESINQLTDLDKDGKLSNVRLHNTEECRLPFVPWVYDDLLTWLTDQNIPLWISLADTPPTEIVETLSKHPNLEVVLVGAHYVHSLMIRPMLHALPNTYLEGIEKLAQEFGTNRLLYGSFFPRYAMGPMLFTLHHLSMSEEDLASICAKNLEGILSLSK
jgi:predicted TIM-barrel fold metal-dependent hydrolase